MSGHKRLKAKDFLSFKAVSGLAANAPGKRVAGTRIMSSAPNHSGHDAPGPIRLAAGGAKCVLGAAANNDGLLKLPTGLA